jgi:uracil-DNA glycosylase family 4
MTHPPECRGCSLDHTGQGFAPAVGPADALICLVGEALGQVEADRSMPFIGPAGGYLNRALGLLNLDRDQLRIGNVNHCRPPKDWLAGAPWELSSISHCRVHRDAFVYSPSHKVYVTLGVIPTRTLAKELLNIDYDGKLDHWQHYVLGDSPPFIVPTYHPSYLLRGQQRLLGSFCAALKRAMEVASFGFTRAPVSLVENPPPDWFAAWASGINEDAWLAVDIETPFKSGSDEDEMVEAVGKITQINFSVHPDQGVTVPWDDRYLKTIRRILATSIPKVFWFERYDVPLLAVHDAPVSGPILDAMLGWHLLQSGLPKSLGFASSYYSDLPPWKHLSKVNFTYYCAMDAVQTLRCMYGIAKDLKSQGQWDVYLRHFVKLDQQALHPMEAIGLKLDPERLRTLHSHLTTEVERLYDEIQTMVPHHLKPLVGGWKKPPDGTPGVEAHTVKKLVPCCTDCGAIDVTPTHEKKCPKRTKDDEEEEARA